MARPDKVAVVDDVKARLEGAAATLLTDYRGLSVGEMAELRIELRKANAQYIVAKNTLTKIAANEAGITGFDEYLVGPTALVFCDDDPVGPAKALKAFSKDHPQLVIKAGLMEGNILDAAETLKLADLDSREDLLAKMAGLMYGALANTARLMNALTEKQARLITAFIEAGGNKDVAEAPVEEAPAAAPVEDAAEDAPAEDAPATDAAPEDAPVTDAAPEAAPAEDAGGEAIEGGGELDDAAEAAAEPSTPEDEAPATPEEAVAADVPTPDVNPAPEPADDEAPTAPVAAADEVAGDPDVEAASDEDAPEA